MRCFEATHGIGIGRGEDGRSSGPYSYPFLQRLRPMSEALSPRSMG